MSLNRLFESSANVKMAAADSMGTTHEQPRPSSDDIVPHSDPFPHVSIMNMAPEYKNASDVI